MKIKNLKLLNKLVKLAYQTAFLSVRQIYAYKICLSLIAKDDFMIKLCVSKNIRSEELHECVKTASKIE